MRNIIGQPVAGDDLYGREYELDRLWEQLEQGEHILMLAPRRVGKTSLMLELENAPRGGWDVINVDVQGGEGPEDCFAAILAKLAADSRYRTRFEAIPFSSTIKNVVEGMSANVDVGVLRVELKRAIGSEWDRVAAQLQARLTNLPDSAERLLVILDELPILISRMLRSGGGKSNADLLLARLRQWRQAPELRGRVHTLVGGSIGLEGLLRRAGLSASINDLVPFRVDPWERPIAVRFLEKLGRDVDFRLDDESIIRLLDLLMDPVPYHVQLFYSALRDACRGDSSRVSPDVIDRCFEEQLAGESGTAHLDHYHTRLEFAFDQQELELAYAILGSACRSRAGVRLTALGGPRRGREHMFRSVLRDLKADGYVREMGRHVVFRSNLLRVWWRKHHVRGENR